MHFTNPNRFIDEINPTVQAPSILLNLYDEVTKFGHVLPGRLGNTLEIYGVNFTLWNEDLINLQTYMNTQTWAPFKTPILNGRRVSVKTYHDYVLAGKAWPAFEGKDDASYANALKLIPTIVDQLSMNEETRQCNFILGAETCFTSFQFMVRNDKIHLFMNARSLNLTQGLPYDALFWAEYLLAPVAKALKKEIAGIHFWVGSLHVLTDRVSN